MTAQSMNDDALLILFVEDNDHDYVAFDRAMRACPLATTIRRCLRAEEALALLADLTAFDLIVADYNLPGDSGLELCRTLLSHQAAPPIVLLTGSGNEQVAVEALKLGCADYIIKDPEQGYLKLLPAVIPQIVQRFREKERGRQADATQRETAARLEQILTNIPVPIFVIDCEHRVTHWNQACEAITGTPAAERIGSRTQWRAFYSSERPVMADLILDNAIEADVDRFYHGKFRCSALIPGAFEAEDFFPHFGENGRWLFFTAAPLRDSEGRVIGAIETLQDVSEQRQAEIALRQSEARFRELSITDALTGLYNARHFHERLNSEIGRAHRYQHALCLLIMDVDNFKRCNDTHGHPEGDRVLARLSDVIGHCLRAGDSAYRYGGEEFAVLLPETGITDALGVAERIRNCFAATPVALANGSALPVTVSIGVALANSGESAAELLRRADDACYQAKTSGKNRVATSDRQ